MSLPSIGSMVIISLYNLVNTFWVAKLGYQAIAALTVTMPFFIMCMAVGVGTGIGINALTSRRFGERNTEAANQAAGQMFFLVVILGILLVAATNLFPRQILSISGATADILDLGEQYLRMIGFATPFLIFSLVSRNIFHASGDTMRPLIFTIIAQACNVVLDPFLIFGWWIFPEMGVGGAALATTISSGLSALMALWYILRGKTAYQIGLRHCIPNLKTITAIYKVGAPSVMMEAMEAVIFALFNHVAAGFGSMVLAAMGIAIRVFDLAFMPIIGTSHGLLPIIGFSLGAKLWHRLWGAVRLATLGVVAFLAVATIFLEIFTPQIVSLFNSDPAILEVAVPGMRIFTATFVLVGPTVMFITTFQGLSKGREALLLNLARQFVFFIPGLYVLSHYLGLTGVWISMPVSDVLSALLSGGWLHREYRMQNKRLASGAEQAVPTPAGPG